MKPYNQTEKEISTNYQTDLESGLSKIEAHNRLQTYGLNKLPDSPREPLIVVFIAQFKNPLIALLLVAASIIFFTGNRADAFIISVVLTFNAMIGTIQEGRTRTLLDSLHRFIKANAIVIRDGKKEIISDELLVPGDLVVVQEGTRVPADIRLIQTTGLQIDESILTGESAAVQKNSDALPEDLPIYEQINMTFRGSYVVGGFAKGIVVGTGRDCEMGRLQKIVETIQTDMPLKKEMERLSYMIVILTFFLCVLLFAVGFYHGKGFNELLAMLTALFICVVPEGLPVVLSLVLATGARRMADIKVLVRKLQGVDALGRCQVIIIDKTGTLTRNEMMVCRLWVEGKTYDVSGQGYYVEGQITLDGASVAMQPNTDLYTMALASSLLSNVAIKPDEQGTGFIVEGDPTEAALSIFSKKMGMNRAQLEQSYRQIFELPFSSTSNYHAVLYEHNNELVVFVAGAPETVLSFSAHQNDAVSGLELFLTQGLRVIAVATRRYPMAEIKNYSASQLQEMISGLTLIGFFGIQDAIRTEVSAVITKARAAGLRIIMATGDHLKTALYVARSVGIYADEKGDEYIDGAEFNQLSKAERFRRLGKTTVYSRLLPENKLELVSLFKNMGKVVAMTGDGVNDAPSLVGADVGIAMGGIGTEVAKQAADVVLLDDSFVNIINAVEQGRHIVYALRRVILYFFATNMGEILVVFFALLLNFPLPILAAQILWLNLITDGFLDIALAMEKKEQDLLSARWLSSSTRLVDTRLLLKMFYMALPMGIGAILIFNQYQSVDLEKARTMTLVTMAMYQWFNAWNCRSETKSIFTIGLFSNPWLILATSFVGLLQYLVVTIPFLQTLFHTVPLSAYDFGIILAVTFPLFVVEELRKWAVRRWWH
jgi:Ca2+-transporting ATPase